MPEEPETSDTTNCHLCGTRVKKIDLRSHKDRCAFLNKSILSAMKQSESIKCLRCNRHLLQWPQIKEPKIFTCVSNHCPLRLIPRRNSGKNLFKCFFCDYHLCPFCEQSQTQVNRQLANNDQSSSPSRRPPDPNPSDNLFVSLPSDTIQIMASGFMHQPSAPTLEEINSSRRASTADLHVALLPEDLGLPPSYESVRFSEVPPPSYESVMFIARPTTLATTSTTLAIPIESPPPYESVILMIPSNLQNQQTNISRV